MSTILQFDQRLRRSTKHEGTPSGDCEILFFTGVRYERADAAPQAMIREPEMAGPPRKQIG